MLNGNCFISEYQSQINAKMMQIVFHRIQHNVSRILSLGLKATVNWLLFVMYQFSSLPIDEYKYKCTVDYLACDN